MRAFRIVVKEASDGGVEIGGYHEDTSGFTEREKTMILAIQAGVEAVVQEIAGAAHWSKSMKVDNPHKELIKRLAARFEDKPLGGIL